MSNVMRSQRIFNPDFEIGTRVVFYRVHHTHRQLMKAHLGESGTVIDMGRHYDTGAPRYLVDFVKPRGGKSQWWISPQFLRPA